MHKITYIVAFILMMWLSSCSSTAPNACFQLTTSPDSLYARRVIGFDAFCSTDAGKFYWDFGNGKTISGTATPQMTYDSAGTYRVALTVGNNNKSAAIAVDIHIKP